MNSDSFFNFKNNELVIYIVCFFSHAAFAPLYLFYGFQSLFMLSIAGAILYGIFIMLLSNPHRHFFINIAYMELIGYSVFVTMATGTDFGTKLYTLCVIPAMFFFVYSTNSSQKYHIFLSCVAALATVFIIWFEFARQGAVFTGFMTAVTLHKQFYRIHTVISTAISILVLLYLSIATQTSLKESALKSRTHAQKLNYIANHDPLTGLMNRRKISLYLKRCAQDKLSSGKDYALCIFDIDSFKSVNDTYGHEAGDKVLVEIAAAVKNSLPHGAKLARWGGEEFLILFTSFSMNITGQLDFIRMVAQSASFTLNADGRQAISVTLTFGLSSSRHLDNPDKIIIDADNSLIYGKRHGKNQVVVSEKF